MRRASCVGLIGALVLVVVPASRAQHHVWSAGDDCGCNACAPVADGCCPPLIPSLLRGIHDTLGCLLCCPGLNGRHDIYRAALNRNDFDTCGSSLLPIYVRKRCCGPVASGCPHCHHAHAAEGEVIETGEMPSEMILEPTPATPIEPSVVPREAMPNPQARRRPMAAPRVATPTPAARQAVLRDRISHAEATDSVPRPVTTSGTARRPRSTSQVQRTGLLDIPRP